MKYKLNKKDIILALILVITVTLVIYSVRWYKVYKEFNYSTAIISKYLPQLTYEEYETYIQEVSNGFVYYCVSDNLDCRKFEKDFRKIVSKHGLNSKMIYLDVKNIPKSNYFDKYFDLNNEINIPYIAYFENHLITDYISNDTSIMNEKEIMKFINKYE